MSGGNLFQCYDGPGPIYGQPITQQIYSQVLDVTAAEAYSKPGLVGMVHVTTAPVVHVQTVALLLPAGVEWTAEPIPGFEGGNG